MELIDDRVIREPDLNNPAVLACELREYAKSVDLQAQSLRPGNPVSGHSNPVHLLTKAAVLMTTASVWIAGQLATPSTPPTSTTPSTTPSEPAPPAPEPVPESAVPQPAGGRRRGG